MPVHMSLWQCLYRHCMQASQALGMQDDTQSSIQVVRGRLETSFSGTDRSPTIERLYEQPAQDLPLHLGPDMSVQTAVYVHTPLYIYAPVIPSAKEIATRSSRAIQVICCSYT